MIMVITSFAILKVSDAKSDDTPRPEAEIANTISNSAPCKDNIVIKSIRLKRRNWENNGTDTIVGQNGDFEVFSYVLGASKKIRAGSLDKSARDNLFIAICEADLFSLRQEYKAPFKSQFSWWGYEITVETSAGTKTVRFHSEDSQIPAVLIQVVRKIMELAQ